ncbi:ATPase RavA [bacterium HR23]|nr:ATPase RavA [bacterium HR23]
MGQDEEDALTTAVAVQEVPRRIVENMKKVIVGKDRAVEQTVIALLCNGHALIEDVPGVGKTMLARSLAKSAGCTFKRIQFTPDLLPTDVTGVSVYNQRTGTFEFRPGPIMAQVVLADEINRATPKTQSALLEAMEERQVTVEGVTHTLPRPFMVLATQNPIEYEGTFPLPEAQLDRFLLRITLGYPSFEEEIAIIERQVQVHPIETIGPVTDPEEIVRAQEAVKGVYVDALIKRYIVSLVEATRKSPEVSLGASPRASLTLFRAAQALAFIRGRDYVLPDDVKELAQPALSHRIIVAPQARMRGLDGRKVVEDILEQVPVPGVRGMA